MRALFCLLIALSAGPLAYQSAAYTRNATAAGIPLFRPDASSIQVLVNGSMQAGATNAQGAVVITAGSNPMQAVMAAVGEWTQAGSAAINFATPLPTTLSNDPNDGKFVVTIEDNATNRSIVGSALAVTLYSYGGNGAIADSDIIFNPDVLISGQLTPFATDHSQGAVDLQSVLAHELGHSLGANHSPVISATMFQAQPACSRFASLAECTAHQLLSPDDIAFANAAYPGTGAGQFGTISGTVTTAAGAISGGLVVAVNPATGATVSGITGADGSYAIHGVPPGSYEVYAQPANGPVGTANLSGLPGINNAVTTFRTTFAGGNQSPATFTVGAGGTAQAPISVDAPATQMQIAILGSGPAGGSGWSYNGGFKAFASGTSVDLLLWGPGISSTSASQIRFVGPGVALRPGTLHTDPSSVINGNTPIRFTVDIAPVAAPTAVTIAIVNGTDAAAFSGGIVLLGSAPVIDPVKKVVNGLSFVPGQAVAPGSLVSVFGSNFTSGITGFTSI
ncbi:MAG TPA: carboxypeptidase regulatory-like domain-containing protein, partial [Bryobacteraceae bacterium]|nr:carboxypeptidase regulatory-like domain-containing protein [Bryobacteraceae bacterium]